MADPLLGDPLDEMSDLLGQTLNIFDAPAPRQPQPDLDNPFLAPATAPLHPLGSLGSGPPPADPVRMSLDLDLLGTSTAPAPVAPPPPASFARFNTAQAEDVPLAEAEEHLTYARQDPSNPFAAPSPRGSAAPAEPYLDDPLAYRTSTPRPAAAQPLLGASTSLAAASAAGPSTSTPGDPHYPSTSAGGGLARPGLSFSLGGAGPSSSAASAAAAAEGPSVRIWVRDPEKHEGPSKLGIRTTYWTYLVRTESTLPGLRTDGTEVRRRFSEFDALHKMLKHAYRGYIIPPLPDKSFIDAKLAHEDFLRLRRADLQAFVRSIAAHPALRDAEALKLFLLQPGELTYNPAWLALLHEAGASPDASDGLVGSLVGGGVGGSKAAAGLSSLVAWVRQSVGAGGGRLHLDEDEQQLRHAKELLRDLQRLLQLCCESARSVCAHMDDVATDLYELGRNVGMLSKWEDTLRAQSGTYTEAGYSAAKRAADCKQLAMATSRQHTLWKSASVKTAASLVSLHDYYILVPEAIAALEERERCLDAIGALEAELGARQAELNRATGSARGPVGGRDRRGYTLTNTVERLDEQLKNLRSQYGTIKARNGEELRRLHLAREQDFHAMMANFAAVQAQLMQASADMYRATYRAFAGMAEAGEGAAAAGGGSGEAGGGSPRGEDDY